MKRIAMMMIRNFFYVIVTLIRMRWMLSHKEKYSEEEIYAVFQLICDRAVKGGNLALEIKGQENIPEKSGFIFYPNHQGMFDVLAIIKGCPKPISVMAKKETENIPILRTIFQLMGAQFIDREDLRQSMQVIRTVSEEVKQGRNYVIFPEGTRSRNGNHLLEFKGGSFKAATKARCPICPVALVDSYKVFDTGSIRRQTVRVEFLKPILYEEYKDMKTTEIAELVKKRIENVVSNYY